MKSNHPYRTDCLLSVLTGALLLAGLSQTVAQVSLVLSTKWTLAPGSRYYLPTSGGNPRGLAINRSTGNILIPSTQGGSNHVEVVSGLDGSDLGSLGTAGGTLTGGALALTHVGVADDGVVYACNLDTGSTSFKIYRWSAEDLTGTIEPTVAFGPAAAGPTATRIGDSFCVRGAGANTQIIASGTGSAYFTIFTTTDGTNFTANQFPVPASPGSGGLSRTVAFDGANNAFWGGKPNDTKLYYISFDLVGLTSTTLSNITLTTAMGMCGVGATNSINILAGIQDNGLVVSASRNLLVYDMSNLSAAAQGGNVAFPAGGTGDGNVTGQAAVGAGMVAALSTQGGVVALNITVQANTPPSITTAPVGAAGVFPTYTLTVGAAGTDPLSYQWLASNDGTSASTSFTNIPGATANSYSLVAAVTNYFEVLVTNNYGSRTSAPVLVSLLAPVTSPVVTQLWRVPSGANGYPYLTSDDATRGMGYDTNLNRVVIASHSGSTAIYILDGQTGTNIGQLDLTGAALGGGTFQVDQVAVADDGAVYCGNLALAGQIFNLNRWSAPTTLASAYPAYSDAGTLAASGDRWGDTMAIRGVGTGTQVALGSRGGTNFALLTTSDGSNFIAAVLAVTNAPPGFAAQGISFGAGNTIWAKAYLGHLYQLAYDPVGLTAGVVSDYANPSQTPSSMTAVGVDAAHGILAGVVLGDTPNDVQLFELTGTADPPVLYQQSFFASANANGNQNAAIAVKYPRIYALDVNNGLLALQYDVPPTTPPLINSPPLSQTVYSNAPNVVLSVGATGSLPLYYQWRFNGVNIPDATSQSYTLHYPPLSASGDYDVIVRNIAGSITSTPPAVLTVIAPASSTVVTQLWALAAGSRAYLDNSSYNTRGLAYDTNTDTVLVADHNNIYVLSGTNGSDLFPLNTAGLVPGYFAVDQVGVADDGIVYACDLGGSVGGGSYDFAITSWSSVSASAAIYQAYGPGDPGSGSGERWGDTMVVRGSGINTEILIGSYDGTNVVLFTTADGANFTPTLIVVTNAPAGFAGQGIAFGAGNTFWAKSPGYNLRLVAYDQAAGMAGVVQDYTAGTQIDSTMDGIGVDVAATLLGGVVYSDTPNDLQLFLLSGNANPPGLIEQVFFDSNNANAQANAVTTLKAGHGFSLDVNNGIVALSYGAPALPGFPITSVSYRPGVGTTLSWVSFNGHSYQVQYKNNVTDVSWTAVGAPIIAAGATSSFTDATATGATRFYRVVGQ